MNAIEVANKVKKYLMPGNVWVVSGPQGEAEVKAAILYNGVAVGVLHFNPEDGSILPLGLHPKVLGVNLPLEKIKRSLPEIINNIKVLEGAEYREPENAWIIPLAYKEMIVSHLKVYRDGIHIIPDYRANQEMQFYTQTIR